MDNTYKDNKNRYVMAYCNMLVDLGVFERVELNFLPVGHTHCDVDQLFSRIAVALRGFYCLNFAHLLEVFLSKLYGIALQLLYWFFGPV